MQVYEKMKTSKTSIVLERCAVRARCGAPKRKSRPEWWVRDKTKDNDKMRRVSTMSNIRKVSKLSNVIRMNRLRNVSWVHKMSERSDSRAWNLSVVSKKSNVSNLSIESRMGIVSRSMSSVSVMRGKIMHDGLRNCEQYRWTRRGTWSIRRAKWERRARQRREHQTLIAQRNKPLNDLI